MPASLDPVFLRLEFLGPRLWGQGNQLVPELNIGDR